MINLKLIARIIGVLLLIESAMLLFCSGVSLFYQGDDLTSFIYTAIISAIVGVLLTFLSKGAEKYLSRRDGYLVVALSWIVVSIVGTIPFYHSGYIPNLADRKSTRLNSSHL